MEIRPAAKIPLITAAPTSYHDVAAFNSAKLTAFPSDVIFT